MSNILSKICVKLCNVKCQIFTVLFTNVFFINAYPTPVSECLQGLYSCTHACMDGGDGSQRCDHNSSNTDALNQP